MEKLGLVVIDEQHRFGVEQRAQLIKKGKAPHILTMTATPIPRTIALTLYGDLDLSVLTEMPQGRKKIKTWVVPWHKRTAAYDWIKDQIKPPEEQGKQTKTQAFIVCPLIEESDKESMKDIRAATAEFERLEKEVFPKLKLGLLHGRIKTKEKDKVINKFRDKKLDILVSTPVVEVGIDIPQATMMMIEAADRFGLAQLHQLRGRVGRSDKQSYCLLFTSTKDKQSLQRLRAMQKYNSGFKLAEIDLKLRGPGEIYGLRQHGFSNLKIASFSDTDLINQTKRAGEKIVNQLSRFPLLKERLKKYKIRDIEPN
jgi:ATP-dependent DNA helicase RecG